MSTLASLIIIMRAGLIMILITVFPFYLFYFAAAVFVKSLSFFPVKNVALLSPSRSGFPGVVYWLVG